MYDDTFLQALFAKRLAYLDQRRVLSQACVADLFVGTMTCVQQTARLEECASVLLADVRQVRLRIRANVS